MSDRRRIVVTGVSRGLGLAMVEEFARLGHVVCGCARSRGEIQDLKLRFLKPHRFDVVDVSDETQVAAWSRAVLEEAGAPDLLLNNAAIINKSAELWEVSAEEFSRIVDVNIKGVFFVLRRFLPAMIERGRGVIVNFSSGWGRGTSPQVAPYCTTKWAIEGMTRALADELPYGLAAIPLNPGIIHTQMLECCFGSQAADYPSPAAWAKKAVPFLLELGPDDNGDALTAPD
jgi:NAD(P)-dependent dehydrogenase (short-subunit alcohol dehydrogenase family)